MDLVCWLLSLKLNAVMVSALPRRRTRKHAHTTKSSFRIDDDCISPMV
jgi:hypothetical protein